MPALGFASLTSLYDPMIQRWSAARRLRASVIENLMLEPEMRILELGAGPGRLAIAIKRLYPSVRIEAIDIDPSMVARARKNASRQGVDVSFHEADMTAVTEAGAFDRVYSTMTFHHLSNSEKKHALWAARLALRPGGCFVVADFGRPRGLSQELLFRFIQQPLDGFENTTPHCSGRYEADVRSSFRSVESALVLRTVAGTLELFVCRI